MQETKMLLIVSFVAFVSGLSVAKYDQPAKGNNFCRIFSTEKHTHTLKTFLSLAIKLNTAGESLAIFQRHFNH